MASSRGRERLRERSTRQFAFGSSTPRDLSHLNTIPAQLRTYDARVEVIREGPDLKEFIIKARSLSREGGGDQRSWAFGSSTPRNLAHLVSIPASQRIYNAKLPKKCATQIELRVIPKPRSTTAPPANRKVQLGKANAEAKRKFTEKDEEVSSEPDFVQDREEFVKELKKEAELRKSEKAKNGKAVKAVVSPTNVVVADVNFAQADEIAIDPNRSVRIRADTYDETQNHPQAAESRVETQQMDDQIKISEMNVSTPTSEVVINEAEEHTTTTNRKSSNKILAAQLLAKVQEAANYDTSEAKCLELGDVGLEKLSEHVDVAPDSEQIATI